MHIFNSLSRPLLRSAVHVRRALNGTPPKISAAEKFLQRYSMPLITRLETVSASASQKISDKIDVIKDKIDSCTAPGTSQACIDNLTLALGGMLAVPFLLNTVSNVCWANLKGFSPERVTLEGQDFVRLYRGITKNEFNLLMAEPTGALFGVAIVPRVLGVSDAISHVLGSYAEDASRVFTSLSTEKHLAAQFAGIYDAFGAIASFLVPASLYEGAFLGMNIHREVLLPTGAMDLSMITSVEIRSKEELLAAKEKEIFYATCGGSTEDSHRFDTPPLLTFDPRNTDQRIAAALKIQGFLGV